MAKLKTGTTISGSIAWHAGNDGAGSGLDADLLDGQQGSYYLNWNNFTNVPTYDNYSSWTISDGSNSEGIASGNTLTVTGTGATSVSYNPTTNTLTIDSTDTDTNTTYSAATNTTLGLVKIGYSENGKNYPVELSNDQMYVNVPWTDTNTNQLTTFVVEDGDGTEVTISHGKEWKFVEGSGIDINWTDTDPGSDADPFDLTIGIKGNEIPGSVDLNTYRTTGIYPQNANADASNGTNYPVAQAGILQVINDDYGNGLHTTQLYSQYNSTNYWHRTYYNGTWSAWRNLAQDTNTDTNNYVDGISFNGSGTLTATRSGLTNLTASLSSGDITGPLGYTPYEEGTALSASSITFTGQLNGNLGAFESLYVSSAADPTVGTLSFIPDGSIGDLGVRIQPNIIAAPPGAYEHWTNFATNSSTTHNVRIGSILNVVGSIQQNGTEIIDISRNAFFPNINVTGALELSNGTDTITASMLSTDTLSFSGDSGQLFSITDSLSGTIFAVNDISGVPSIEVDDDGTIRLAETFGNVLIGTAVDNGTDKVQINGTLATSDGTSTNWKQAYDNYITGIAVSGTSTKTITLTQRDGGTLTANFTDIDTNTTYSTATSTTLGLVKIGYTETGQNYPVELSSGQMYVNVPWTDTNTNNYVSDISFNGSGTLTATRSGLTNLTASLAAGDITGPLGYTPYEEGTALNASSLAIGVASPTAGHQIHVQSTGPARILLEADTDNATETDNAQIIFNQDGGAVVGSIGFQTNTNSLEIFNQFNEYVYIGVNNANRFRLDGSGNGIFTGNITAYGSVSDIRRKENIEKIPNALEKVQQLNGVNFNYKNESERLTGVIAQEVQKVLPEAVYEHVDMEENEMLAVRHGNMVGLLIEAIKEQQSQIEELKAQVQSLKEK